MANGHSGAGRAREAGSPGAGEFVVRLGHLARSLQNEDDVDATLHAIVVAAITTIPGAGCAAISELRRSRRVYTRVATAELAMAVGRAQYDTGQGPCLDAIHEQHTVRVSNLNAETRWPRFASRAARLGALSMLSFPFVQRDNLGALNLYAQRPDAFTDESEQVGLLFVTHAAVAMSGAQQQAHMAAALSARDLIGQAKGILMERHKLTAAQAFAMMVRASQDSNTKLTDVAGAIAETGEFSPRTS